MHTANIVIREYVKWLLIRGQKTPGKSLNFQAQKVAAVAYSKWLFTRDSKSLTGKVLVFWIRGRLWEVVLKS